MAGEPVGLIHDAAVRRGDHAAISLQHQIDAVFLRERARASDPIGLNLRDRAVRSGATSRPDAA